MTAASFTPAGPFSLASSIRFLEGFTPASYDGAADGVLRLAFPSDDAVSVIGCAVRQEEAAADGRPGTVRAEFTVHADSDAGSGDGGDGGGAAPLPAHTGAGEAARAQLARILSLDVDGTGFPALAEADPIVAGLQADYPGLRPVCFHSPYEAAVWSVIGNRIRRTQAAAIKARLAREHGRAVDVAGQRLHAFPAPAVLRSLGHVPGLTGIKVERLHAIAEAALDGRLDAAALRALPTEQALAALRELPGIGPFSAELVLIRGAGHPDVFPSSEPRLHRAMASAYGLDDATAASPGRLARIADAWRPFRSWVALLLRNRAQEETAAT
ncbi:DNA-3-methyladenine glycosylase family protein [Streptomyces daliensis]